MLVLYYLDVLSAFIIVGVSVWFFFLQAPVLAKSLGFDNFLGVQMTLTQKHADLLVVLNLSISLMSLVNPLPYSDPYANIGLVLSVLNKVYLLPMAIQKGAFSMPYEMKDHNLLILNMMAILVLTAYHAFIKIQAIKQFY